MKVKIQGRKRRVKVVGKLGRHDVIDGHIVYTPPDPIRPIPALKPEDGRAESIEYQQMGLNIIRKRYRLRKDRQAKSRIAKERQALRC